MLITKRNGNTAQFEKKKIYDAIIKAMKYGSGILEENVAIDIANEIEEMLLNRDDVNIKCVSIYDIALSNVLGALMAVLI